MEHMIQLHIEKLPEGLYLATSDEVQGLVAQGRTIQETIEIARDALNTLLGKVDVLMLNDGEARMLTEAGNLVRAGR